MDLVAMIKKLPPITKTLCLSLAVVTLPVVANMVSWYRIPLYPTLVFRKLQFWRLYTSFFLGSCNPRFIFDMALLYQFTNDLESGPYMRKSGDLCWQMIWAGALITIASIPVHSAVYFRPLLHCIAYLACALAPFGAMHSICGVGSMRKQYQPYFLLLLELLINGPRVLAQCLAGTAIGHLWWWGIWGSALGGTGGRFARYGRAPKFVEEYFRDLPVTPGGGPGAGRGANHGGGVRVYPPRKFADEARETGTTTGGHNWGSGRKLG